MYRCTAVCVFFFSVLFYLGLCFVCVVVIWFRVVCWLTSNQTVLGTGTLGCVYGGGACVCVVDALPALCMIRFV